MNNLRFFTIMLVFGAVALTEPAVAGELKAVSTLKTDFVMIRKVAVLKETLSSRGHLMLSDGGKLRFETISPSRSVIIINGKKGWLHYPDLDVTKPFDTVSDPVMKLMVEQLTALTRGDFPALTSIYKVSDEGNGVKALVPIDAQIKKLFKSLKVTMDKNGGVSDVVMFTSNGDTTTIRFENRVLNPVLDASLFEKPVKKK